MHSVLPDSTNNVAVLMRSCPFGSISHAYADQNTFVLDAYGEPLIIASGYYEIYGNPHHAEWTWQTKASNSVLVDGEGQKTRDWRAKGRLTTFKTTVAGDYVVGDAKEAYGGRLDRFDRRIVFLRPVHTGGEPIVVIRDELAAPEPATYQFLLHALNQMTITPTKQRVTIARQAARCQVDFLAPQRLTLDDVATDAQAASVCTIDDVMHSAVQFEGTALTHAGTTIESVSAGDGSSPTYVHAAVGR